MEATYTALCRHDTDLTIEKITLDDREGMQRIRDEIQMVIQE